MTGRLVAAAAIFAAGMVGWKLGRASGLLDSAIALVCRDETIDAMGRYIAYQERRLDLLDVDPAGRPGDVERWLAERERGS